MRYIVVPGQDRNVGRGVKASNDKKGERSSNLRGLFQKLPGCSLGPDPRVPLVQFLYPRRHGSLGTGDLSLARVKYALQPQLHLVAALIDNSTDDKEPIRST